MGMNRKISVFTAFMIIFSAILIHYFGLVNESLQMKISYAEQQPKCVYLTFDDGPSSRVTPKILDTLEAEGVKATFFVVGRNAEGREDIVKRAAEEGHTIGVHSYSHDYGSIYSSPSALLSDIEKCNDVIERVTGKRSEVYRFPGGSFGIKDELTAAVKRAGYRYEDWNASLRDAEIAGASPDRLFEEAVRSSAGKTKVVLLCHDSTDKTSTASALTDIICYFRGEGYKFCKF